MKIIDTDLHGLKIIEPTVYSDERGFFYESFNQREFNQAIGQDIVFVQDNHSYSTQGVLRGLHFQRAPHAQGKLVRVVQGEIFDVVVDIRPESKTFGKWHGECLSGENKRQAWIPAGFAHGFLVLSPFADVLYKASDYWHPGSEATILWNDTDIGIDWPVLNTSYILSDKDLSGKTLRMAGCTCGKN